MGQREWEKCRFGLFKIPPSPTPGQDAASEVGGGSSQAAPKALRGGNLSLWNEKLGKKGPCGQNGEGGSCYWFLSFSSHPGILPEASHWHCGIAQGGPNLRFLTKGPGPGAPKSWGGWEHGEQAGRCFQFRQLFSPCPPLLPQTIAGSRHSPPDPAEPGPPSKCFWGGDSLGLSPLEGHLWGHWGKEPGPGLPASQDWLDCVLLGGEEAAGREGAKRAGWDGARARVPEAREVGMWEGGIMEHEAGDRGTGLCRRRAQKPRPGGCP